LEWLPNGSGLILTLAKQGNSQIYFMSYPDGEITPITNDSNDYAILSLTADSKFIATTQQNLYSTIWSAASVKQETLTQLTSGITVIDGSLGLSWTPNGHILYASKGSTEDFQIWQMSQDGKDRKRLTSGQPDKFWPVASPDGRYIAYMTGNMDIWRMDADGINPKLLSSGEPSRYPHFTPDKKWLVYSTLGKEKCELIKTEVEGIRKVKLASERMIYGSAISPDGSQIAYAFLDPQTSDKTWIKIIKCDNGDLITSFPLPSSARRWIIQWTPDANGIAFLVFEGDTSNLYVQPIDGSAIKQLTNFGHEKDLDTKSIRNFSWSLDGKHIAYSRGKIYYDLVLIEDVHK
jgi:Tol biopolymer transport system component